MYINKTSPYSIVITQLIHIQTTVEQHGNETAIADNRTKVIIVTVLTYNVYKCMIYDKHFCVYYILCLYILVFFCVV